MRLASFNVQAVALNAHPPAKGVTRISSSPMPNGKRQAKRSEARFSKRRAITCPSPLICASANGTGLVTSSRPVAFSRREEIAPPASKVKVTYSLSSMATGASPETVCSRTCVFCTPPVPSS